MKVIVVLDQSGSMCLTDPPGSQETAGFCEQIGGVVPPGVTEPARAIALKRLLAQLSGTPNAQLSLVPFETNVKNPCPPATTTGRFAPVNDPAFLIAASALQSQLGKGSDYEGALGFVYATLASDIASVKLTNPALLAVTRYVVIFVSDGTPYPRCSANDALPSYADSTAPGGIWPDSPGAGSFCNLSSPDGGGDVINGFVPGGDRNQNAALFGSVDQMRALVQQQGAGDVRFHSMLLFNPANVALCGAICQDIYGTFPEVASAQYPSAALAVSRYTLQQLATHGGGTYSEFLNNGDGGVRSFSMGGVDLAGSTCP